MVVEGIANGNLSHVFTSYRVSIDRKGFSTFEVLRRNIIDTLAVYLHIIISV